MIALSNDSVAPMPGSTKIRPITHMARGIQDNQFENYATGSSIIRAGITINELIYNVANSTDQWFEIYNNNNSAMNIGSYRMGDIDQVTG
ncbi:MAG: hypothetical protein U9Q15_04970 [Patescibacteria group bacterium]|nr:hypothetical protein [Patescibacteria group bacterium]